MSCQPEGDRPLESRGDGVPSRVRGNAEKKLSRGQPREGTASVGTGHRRSAVVHGRPQTPPPPQQTLLGWERSHLTSVMQSPGEEEEGHASGAA
jgi:hypothetical protein